MKHLREYEEQEVKDLMGDLEKIGQNPPKGWILSVFPYNTSDGPERGPKGTLYYAITAHTLQEAYFLVAEANGGLPETELEELVSDVEDFSDLEDVIASASEYESGFIYLQHWEGLVPRNRETNLVEISNSNPFGVIKELSKEFTNVQAVMSANT